MITISSTREAGGEPRMALTPETTKKIKSLGARTLLQAGAGERSCMHDGLYREAGAEIVGRAAALIPGRPRAHANFRRDGGRHEARLAGRGCEKRVEAQA